MPLKGLGYFKGKDPPMAMEDNEYPDWLWGLLDSVKKASKGGEEIAGDAFGTYMNDVQRSTRS
jgi:large subunit ribosomal protein L54